MNPSPLHDAPATVPEASPHDGKAAAGPLPPISIVVPTYKEVLNIPHLVEQIEKVRDAHGLTVELLLMDDNSQDGTEAAVAQLNKDWVRLIVRTHDRGLSPAVIDGLRAARHDVFVVMDADLSHPPERIPDMVRALQNGADFVIGSRYVPGGTTDAEWGVFRWLNSKVATLLAWPLTSARDPMAGFFALTRPTFERGQANLNPVGYKIGLELMVKCQCRAVSEVPIHFADRKFGSSKLSLKEQLRYLQHLRRLYIYRFWTWAHLAQFLVVGASGLVVNLIVATLLLLIGTPSKVAYAGGIGVSVLSNFALNRRFTFSYARHESILWQFVGFVASCSLGIVLQWLTSVLIEPYVLPVLPEHPILAHQLAIFAGVVAGTVSNFVFTRYIIFKFEGPPPRQAHGS
jgi:dolichol-phosphate mannosyltransferase